MNTLRGASPLDIFAAVVFGLAIIHTFSVKQFEHLATKFREGSVGENLFHMLGEIEVVFGLWAAVLVTGMVLVKGDAYAVKYLDSISFDEPIFVFAIMAMAATRPVVDLANTIIGGLARLLPLDDTLSFFLVALIVGPLLGSFITEPAAMTVTALILKRRYYDHGMSSKFMYATLGVLFVNVSVGGTLTNFAAPPVIMVANHWGWTVGHMLEFFGYKATAAVIVNTLALTILFRRELARIALSAEKRQTGARGGSSSRAPWWLILIHVLFLAGVVLNSEHIVIFMGIFLFFLGVVAVTDEYQAELQLREALLVAFFLGGLVTIGGLQHWWLSPIVNKDLGPSGLFFGATGLTAITDNAALTFLGYKAGITVHALRYALMAGAVAGGGLTVIANAPNPAGYGILKDSFGVEGVSPIGLLIAALLPTAVVVCFLWFLPSL